MKWENFTADRVAGFKCKPGKKQSIYWDGKTPGLGLRVTAAGAKSYIFQTDLDGKTIRMTIGDPRTWGIGRAQGEATRLKTMTDQGDDPRQVKADKGAALQAAKLAKEAKAAALVMQEARETVTLGMAWPEYIAAKKSAWGALHLHDHVKAMQAGGEKRKRSHKLTEPGTLASLAMVRLVDLTPELMTEWAKVEGAKRPARARNARTLLSTFLNWCAAHPTYKAIVTGNAAQSKEAKKELGKAKPKNDALQREQLPAWFVAVKQIGNPAISAYVQAMLLTGARPNELITVRWADVDFQWNSLTIKDKVEGLRVIPLTPYVAQLLAALPRRNEWVFSSLTSVSGHLVEPRIAHDKACAVAGLDVTLHGLRRSFASLCEWIEMPAGIGAQIQGHKPQGVREQHYIRRPLDLLRMWHVKIEAWILEQAGIESIPAQAGLRVVK
ncbi:MAG: integrase family protein [Candidatus Nitrotoga sp.]|nr:integrase family protein [Candidatus Nitrotoga sp.]MDP1855396.1 integrase family protein [Candidatus Nitrotoga sp.]